MSTLKNCTARQLRLQKTRVGNGGQTNVKDRAQSSRSKICRYIVTEFVKLSDEFDTRCCHLKDVSFLTVYRLSHFKPISKKFCGDES